jgi:HEPN domain-containing protein
VSDDVEYAAWWWRLAIGELAGARALAAQEAAPARLAASLAQQAAEKALKAVVAIEADEPPRTHDLVALARSLRNAPAIHGRIDDLLRLTDVVMSSRYPDPTEPSFGWTEVRELIDLAASIIEDVRRILDRRGVATRSLDQA